MRLNMKRRRILFICTGNTCRSPMAEAILRAEIKKRKIKWWDVASRGLNADVGGTISDNSRLALTEIGIAFENFKPKQLTENIVDSSVLVVTMTESQKQLFGERGNVRSVKDLCGFDVPDPYGFSIEAYKITRDLIFQACTTIIEEFILKYEE